MIPSEIDVNAMVEERVCLLKAAHPEVAYELHLTPELPRAVADPDLIKGVLTNLLENAAEAVKSGGVVMARTSVTEERLRVEIHDSGPGLSDQARLSLFEPAISFNKGCYIGQETIERATARGGIKRRLFGIRVDGDDVPPIGASIMFADKAVGVLTSVVESPTYGVIGLALIQHGAWGEGTRVSLTGASDLADVSARITDVPFANR